MTQCRSRLAAEYYLASGGNGFRTGVTLAMCARMYGVKVASVHVYVAKIRKERRVDQGATPEDECTL